MYNLIFVFGGLSLLFLTGILATSFWIFRKTIKIHIATYQLLDDAKVTRKETTALFSQIQALRILEDKLALSKPLPPTRGWVGSPDFLLTIAEQILSTKPTVVVECSSGVSTLVIARCLQLNGVGHVYSLEHEKTYAAQTENMLKEFGVGEGATIVHAPLLKNAENQLWYDESQLPRDIRAIEVLVVDGPPMNTAPLARLPALPRLLHLMDSRAVVILDDADREAERETISQWLKMMPDFQVNYLHHEKGCVILTRKSD